MLPPETGGDRTFFEGIVYRVTVRRDGDGSQSRVVVAFCRGTRHLRWAKELLEHDVHSAQHFGHEEISAGFIQRAFCTFIPAQFTREPEALRGGAGGGRGHGGGG